MIRHHASRIVCVILLLAVGLAAGPAWASWAFAPSYFSHAADSGVRVAQYAPKDKAYSRDDGTYLQSGYRQHRLRLRGPNGSSDNIHIVETWGEGDRIRPYGEWLRPYRAGATPYGPWGNPQGPWTRPFDSWNNPYGLGQIPQRFEHRYSGPWSGGHPHGGYPSGGGPGGHPPGGGHGSGPPSGHGPGGGHSPGPGHGSGHPSGPPGP